MRHTRRCKLKIFHHLERKLVYFFSITTYYISGIYTGIQLLAGLIIMCSYQVSACRRQGSKQSNETYTVLQKKHYLRPSGYFLLVLDFKYMYVIMGLSSIIHRGCRKTIPLMCRSSKHIKWEQFYPEIGQIQMHIPQRVVFSSYKACIPSSSVIVNMSRLWAWFPNFAFSRLLFSS